MQDAMWQVACEDEACVSVSSSRQTEFCSFYASLLARLGLIGLVMKH